MSLNLSLKYSLEDGLQLSFSIVSVSIQEETPKISTLSPTCRRSTKAEETKFFMGMVSFPINCTLFQRPNFSDSAIPYPRLNWLETIPFTAAHTHTTYIWEYMVSPSPGKHQ